MVWIVAHIPSSASPSPPSSSLPASRDSGPPAASPLERLLGLPRKVVGHWPTPLTRLEPFEAAIGARTEIWIKRDDIQNVVLAGNKVRKFELIVGDAIARGYDTLVTTGAVQSNSARTGAALATAAGMDCVLLLEGNEPDQPAGNLLIDRLLGVEIRYAPGASWRALNDGVNEIVAERTAAGAKAFAAPVGASSPLGSLGFALAYLELQTQLDQAGISPSAIVHTTTSGGTHAGLLVGRQLAGHTAVSRPIVGFDAGRLFRHPAEGHLDLAHQAAGLIGLPLELSADDVIIDDSQVGPGYGVATPECVDAITTLARTEAILCDPVYSGKGLAGLVQTAQSPDHDGPLVFWHTGGYHALFDPHYAQAVL